MKYIALIHNNPEAWQALSQAERDEHNTDADADAFLKMVTDHLDHDWRLPRRSPQGRDPT